MVSVIDWFYPWQLCQNSLTICSHYLVCDSSLYPPCILLTHIFFNLFISVNCNFETPLPWPNLGGSWKTFDQWPVKQSIKSWNYTILLISNYIHTPCLSPLDIWNIECHSIFFQFRNIKFKKLKKSIWFRNWFLQATQAVKIKFELDKKIKFVLKSIFFRVCNKLPNWHFKNQAQIDTVLGSHCPCTWVAD